MSTLFNNRYECRSFLDGIPVLVSGTGFGFCLLKFLFIAFLLLLQEGILLGNSKHNMITFKFKLKTQHMSYYRS